KDRDAQRAYDDAHVCEVEFSADELGTFTLRCEREFTPLRWSLRRPTTAFIARLYDDAGSGTPLVERYSFEQPDAGEELPQSPEYEAPCTGGLYTATLGEFKATIIVPPVVRALGDLRCEPRFNSTQSTPESVGKLLNLAQLWGEARLSGDPISGSRRGVVLRALAAHIQSLVAGRTWARQELRLRDERGLLDLSRQVSAGGWRGSHFSEALMREYGELAEQAPSKRVGRLAWLAEDFGITPPRVAQGELIEGDAQAVGPDCAAWLAEFSLRIASSPMTLAAWAKDDTDAGIRTLLEVPTLLRAARFLVLAVELCRKPTQAPGEIYAGWGWSACGE
ncbi:MAG: hypothetical protein KC492_10400, partial [Myxococcales bacterium]|nr:hypothetical protein [Myxococcales bacterium]